MDLGFALPVSGSWSSAATVRLVAQRAEQLGYHSLWTFQRLLHPAHGEWGETYHSVQDPIVTLAHAAALTERARLGVAVLNAPFHIPLVLAKQLTTLDVLSGGRLDVGLGMGWAEEEFEAVGVPRQERVGRTLETVRCLRAAWGPDPVSFEGKHFRIAEATVQPKPVQQPSPPILMGGSVPTALRRVGRVADGWISASRHDLYRVGEAIETIKTAAHEAGRDPEALRFVVRGVVRLGTAVTDRDGRRRRLTGAVDEIRGDLDALGSEGVTEVFVDPNFSPDVVSPGAVAERALATALDVMERLAPTR